MDFVKKHYEKIILSAVLLGVIGFLMFLPFLISHDQDEQKAMADTVTSPRVAPLPPLDLTRQTNALERLLSPANFDFSTTNKLFNPVEWKKTANGDLIKIKSGNEVGAGAVVVTKITPLYLVITLDQVVTNELGVRYIVGIEHQAAPYPAMRHKQQRFVSLDDPKKDAFTLIQVKGAPENPDELVLKLADTDETAVIALGKPFRRVDAYSADLKYDPENKKFLGRRVGAPLLFGGEDYIVVAIDADEVILSAQSNQKKTTLRYAP
jgi:hypothetical protein